MPISNYPKIRLKPGRELIIKSGHPWIFSGAIHSRDSDLKAGDVVQAVSHQGRILGTGFYHPASDITFRLLTQNKDQSIDSDFWARRLKQAVTIRESVIDSGTNAYRLINAEGDGTPGLIVDRYANILVVSFQTLGIDLYRDTLLGLLKDQQHPDYVYERSESRSRRQEGLENRAGWLGPSPSVNTVEISENGLRFAVDIVEGQKTGFFLDQRDNRKLVQALSRNQSVLNCFSYTGGFSVYAAKGGAKEVVSVEASQSANLLASQNLQMNELQDVNFPVVSADVFKYLRESKERHNLIILDPPAFCKSKKEVARATRGYKEINLQAMKRLDESGLLLTFSCSNHIDSDLFRKIVLGAAKDAGKRVKLLKTLGPGPDHPTLLAHPEGAYLKGLLLSVEDE